MRMINKAFTLILFLAASMVGFTQSDTQEEPRQTFGEQVFLPSIEIGYMHELADELGGGVLLKTSIEYRVRNNNDIFFRINYDTYNADYELDPENGITNVIKGTAHFTDLLFGAGYRFGDNKWRCFIMVQPGIKYYNFPEPVITNTAINIEQGKSRTFCTRATLGFEYYITEKSAISLDFLQGQVWDETAFWKDSGSAIGFSVGFITSLM